MASRQMKYADLCGRAISQVMALKVSLQLVFLSLWVIQEKMKPWASFSASADD